MMAFLSRLLGRAIACGFILAAPAGAQVVVDWVQPTAGVSIAVDADDNVYTAYYVYALGEEITLTKRDSDGDLLWEASYDQTDQTKWEQATWVATDSAGDVLVAGTMKSGYSNPVDAASILMKYAPDGTLLWRQVYESAFDGSYTKKCLVDADDNVYVLGMGSGPPGYVTKIKKFAPDGAEVWTYYDADGIGRPINFKLTPDDHLVVTGRSIYGSLNGYAKIDLQGNAVWSFTGVPSLTVGDADGDGLGNTYLVNGEYVMGGGGVVTKLDSLGLPLWEDVYPLAAFRVEVGPDERAVVSGFPDTGSPGAAFVKIDENGGVVWQNLDADGPLGLLLHAHMLLDASGDAYLAAGTLFEMAVCKVTSDGASAWTQTVGGSYANAIALGNDGRSVFVVGGMTARFVDETEVPPAVVVDDADPEFVVLSGTWKVRSFANAEGGAARLRPSGMGTRKVTWMAGSLLEPGLYDVYVWKFEHPRQASMATDAPFQVTHAGGVSDWILIDQSAPGSEWVHLGTFAFEGAPGEGVTLSDGGGGWVAADAVKLQWVGAY